MKRFMKHLLSLTAMLTLAFTAVSAEAKPAKKGKGFKKSAKHGEVVQMSKVPAGKKGNLAQGGKGHFDGRRHHAYQSTPPPRRKALRQQRRSWVGKTWIPGRWRYCAHVGRYTWMDGYWVRTRPNHRWVQGHWAQGPYGWHFVNGYWM